jgi:uncharacterized protein YndB with AHSA1/START domain
MIRWILYVLLGLAGLVALVAVVGLLLPKAHHASREATYPAPPADVFAIIADPARYAEWRADVSRVEILPDDGRGVQFREHGRHGPILFRVESAVARSRMVTRIADPSLPFGGTWTYDVQPTASGGTTLRITEDGEVRNPIFRFLSRFFFSQTATIEAYQAALGKRLAGRP